MRRGAPEHIEAPRRTRRARCGLSYGQGVCVGGCVRQLQLAKSAIRAGIDTLMETLGKTYDDIEKVIIAGGFGA